MFRDLSCKSVFQAVKLGSALGFALALMYGMGFVIYGIAHTSFCIIARPANEVPQTLLANALSVLIGAMFFAVLFSLVAALIQAGTLALIYGLARRLNPENNSRIGAWIGLLAAAALFLVLLLLFRGGPQILIQVFWRQSFIFWFGLPAGLFIALNAWLGGHLHFGATLQAEPAGRKDPAMVFTR